jgi:hypothetical protein
VKLLVIGIGVTDMGKQLGRISVAFISAAIDPIPASAA